ncbi:MAG: hypothetical protein PHF20_01390 [Halothiobacillaceae bacterium]|nr:hypothetical protein [Halothiobacillaceae bacterium]
MSGTVKLLSHEANFANGGKVSLILNYADPSTDELFLFENLDQMEECALERPFVPRSVWEEMVEMLAETTAVHNPKFLS